MDREDVMKIIGMALAMVGAAVLVNLPVEVLIVLAEWFLIGIAACGAWYVMRQRQDRERIEQEQDDGIL